jgi:acyl-CoA thioester hydrolase
LEHARIAYISHLGLWEGGSFLDVGIILADTRVTFQSPILFEHRIQVGVRTTRLGNKSLTMEYCIVESQTKQELATASAVLVAFDYHHNKTILIPDHWRQTIAAFEKLAQTN